MSLRKNMKIKASKEDDTPLSPDAQRLYLEFKEKMRKINEHKKNENDFEKQSAMPNQFGAPHEAAKQNYDENASERMELKRFLKYEKEKIYTIERIAIKDPEYRTQEEKHFLMMYLKFKVPFFKSMQKEVLNMLTERFTSKEF